MKFRVAGIGALPTVASTGGFTDQEMGQFMINAFESAWIDKGRRDAFVARVRGYLAHV